MKPMYEIGNMRDIEQCRQLLHNRIAAKEKAIMKNAGNIRNEWSLITNISSGIGTALRILSPKASYIVAGISIWKAIARLWKRH